MTPGARVAAMIQILDSVLEGIPTEKALTNWGRSNRFAGSKDRAAIRDFVFQAIRCRRSAGAWPKPLSARAWAIGSLSINKAPLNDFFNNVRYSPEPLRDGEEVRAVATEQNILDLQDWIIDNLISFYGFETTARLSEIMRNRAPTSLRVNPLKASLTTVRKSLKNIDIDAISNPTCDTALTVKTNLRKVVLSDIYKKGLFELQDAASQAVAKMIPAEGNVLDYCAGGGGKALAVSAQTAKSVFAHDINPSRLAEIQERAIRGGHDIKIIHNHEIKNFGQFDSVYCDVPCSGSGAWRRSPEEKWKLTPDDLKIYIKLQRKILIKAESLVKDGGYLSMITCSIFECENQIQRDFIVQNFKDLTLVHESQYLPNENHDGFYIVVLKKSN